MTAEVGVMNKHGIALAADSAGTISDSSGRRKIFNHSEKLFCISSNSPVGLMIYQNANLAGIPWSVIIKEYRNENLKRLETLEKHSDNFFAFLNNISKTKSIVDEEEQYIYIQLTEHLNYIKNGVKRIAVNEQLSIDDINVFVSITNKQIIEYEKVISGYKYADGFDLDDLQKLQVKYLVKVENIINNSKIFYVDDNIKTKEDRMGIVETRKLMLQSRDLFVSKFFEALIKVDNRSSLYTGVVIAGYGDEDWLPKLRHYKIFGYLNLKLKYNFVESSEISVSKGAEINAFAQNDMVFSYLQGVHPYYKSLIDEYNTSFRILSNSTNAQNDSVITNLKELHDKFLSQISGEIHMSVDNLLRSIAELPKPELANMAETLVNLTSFKQRITMTDETVGGPIDVAMITKSEGFIWIKRKYYFDSKINSHYFRR